MLQLLKQGGSFYMAFGLIMFASEIEPLDDAVNACSCDYVRIIFVLHAIGTLL